MKSFRIIFFIIIAVMIDIGIEAKTQDNSLFLNNTSVTAEGIVDF